MVNWAAMAAREDRAKDQERVRQVAQRPENRGKRKFRKKKGSRARIFTAVESDEYLRERRRRPAVTQAQAGLPPGVPIQEGNILPGPLTPIVPGGMAPIQRAMIAKAEAEGVPLIGGGLRARAAAGVLRNLPGIGRYLGRPDTGIGRFLGQSPLLARALPWLGGAAGAAALQSVGEWGLDRLREPREGRMYPTSQMPAVRPGGGPMDLARQPLGPLSRGQEFPGGPFVVKTWDTYPGSGVTGGGSWPIFALLSDGRIVVSKPNGSWKVYRPKKNLVISSNPRLRDIRKLDRMHKRVTKMMRRMVPARRK